MLAKVNIWEYNITWNLLTTSNLSSASGTWNYNWSWVSITNQLAIENNKQYILKFNFNWDLPETKKYLTVYVNTSSWYVPSLFNNKEVVKWDNLIGFKFTGANYWNINSGLYPAYLTEQWVNPAYDYKNDYLSGNNVTSFEIYDGVSINSKVIYKIDIIHIRELKQIGKKATYTLLWKHIDDTRIVDKNTFTDSDKIEYCKKNGASHSINKTNYTATGYGYIVYTGGSGSNVAQIMINGNIVAYCNNSYMSGIQFFKPWDYIYVYNLTSIKWYDYY